MSALEGASTDVSHMPDSLMKVYDGPRMRDYGAKLLINLRYGPEPSINLHKGMKTLVMNLHHGQKLPKSLHNRPKLLVNVHCGPAATKPSLRR